VRPLGTDLQDNLAVTRHPPRIIGAA
jgi:hypothetical protein